MRLWLALTAPFPAVYAQGLPAKNGGSAFEPQGALPSSAPAIDTAEPIDPGDLSAGIIFMLDGDQLTLPEDVTARLAGVDPSQMANEVLLALGATGRFRNVSVRSAGRAVVGSGKPRYVVEALPQRRVSDVSISGLGFLEDAQYKRVLKSKVGAPFIEDDLFDDAARLTSRLSQRGYLGAKVNPPVTETSTTGDVRLSFDVDRRVRRAHIRA